MSKQFPNKHIQIAFRHMKMFNLTHNERNANSDYDEILFCTCQISKDEKG